MLVNGPEAEALQDAIAKAVIAYSDFLERNGLIWEFGCDPTDPDFPRMKAHALVVTRDYGDANGGVEIVLKDGALDRLFGDGVNQTLTGSTLIRNVRAPKGLDHLPANYDLPGC